MYGSSDRICSRAYFSVENWKHTTRCGGPEKMVGTSQYRESATEDGLSFKSCSGSINDLAWSACGSLLAACSDDGAICVVIEIKKRSNG